jgi:protein-serine/threonine kinase
VQIPTLTPDYQLGMSDLLPPSPSAANYSSRVFAPSLSTLSSSVPSTEASAVRNIAASASVSTTSLGLPHANSPPLSDPSYSYSNNTSSFNSGAPNGSFGPAIRPLDFGALMLSHEGTHAELARTVADLTQWLSVVEVGLSGMLDTAADEDTIAEEQEDHATEVRTELLIR